MRRSSVLSLCIIGVATTLAMVACGGENQRTRINDRDGRGREATAATLGKLKPVKCGDTETKEILDLKTLKAELMTLNIDPSYTYIRDMTSHELTGFALRIDELGVENPNDKFAHNFFLMNRLGFDIKALGDLVTAQSLFNFDENANSCEKVVVRVNSSFAAYESIANKAVIPEGETRVREVGAQGDLEIDFEIDVQRSNRNQLVLKGPSDIWLVYRVDRGASEISAQWISPASEIFCEGDEPKMHILNFEQILTWDNDNIVQLAKPFVGKIKTYLKSTTDLEKIEENGNNYDMDIKTAIVVNAKPNRDFNQICQPAAESSEESTNPATETSDEAVNEDPPEEDSQTVIPKIENMEVTTPIDL